MTSVSLHILSLELPNWLFLCEDLSLADIGIRLISHLSTELISVVAFFLLLLVGFGCRVFFFGVKNFQNHREKKIIHCLMSAQKKKFGPIVGSV